jgi:hypothetical protein
MPLEVLARAIPIILIILTKRCRQGFGLATTCFNADRSAERLALAFGP